MATKRLVLGVFGTAHPWPTRTASCKRQRATGRAQKGIHWPVVEASAEALDGTVGTCISHGSIILSPMTGSTAHISKKVFALHTGAPRCLHLPHPPSPFL